MHPIPSRRRNETVRQSRAPPASPSVKSRVNAHLFARITTRTTLKSTRHARNATRRAHLSPAPQLPHLEQISRVHRARLSHRARGRLVAHLFLHVIPRRRLHHRAVIERVHRVAKFTTVHGARSVLSSSLGAHASGSRRVRARMNESRFEMGAHRIVRARTRVWSTRANHEREDDRSRREADDRASRARVDATRHRPVGRTRNDRPTRYHLVFAR